MSSIKKSANTLWDNLKFITAMNKLVESGELVKAQVKDEKFDLEKVMAYLIAKVHNDPDLGVYLKAQKHRLTKSSLQKQLLPFIFNKERGGLLGQYVAEGWPLDGYCKHYQYIPRGLVEIKERQLRGSSAPKQPVEFIRGILRLVSDGESVESIAIPESSMSKPIPIMSKDIEGIMFPHAPSLGLPYNGKMSKNVLRCAMEIAERDHFAVILTGGLMHLRMKQTHGNTHNYLARTSAMDLDLEVFDPDHRKMVEKAMKEGEGDALVFSTLLENFENLRSALRKIFCSSKKATRGAARFSTPVYLQLGAFEEELITLGAQAEIRMQVIQQQHKLQRAINEKNALIKNADDNKKSQLEREREMLIAEKARAVITHVHDVHGTPAYEKLRSWVIKKLCDAIPGVVFIGTGASFIEYKGKVIAVQQVGGDTIAPNLINSFIRTKGNKSTRLGNLPDCVVLCNRYTPHVSGTFIKETKYNVSKYAPIIALPAAIDGEFVKKKFAERGLFGGQTRIQKLIGNERFQPGVVVIDSVSHNWTTQLYDISTVHHLGGPLRKDETWKKRKGDRKYFNNLNFSDLHSGHPWEKHVCDPYPPNPFDAVNVKKSKQDVNEVVGEEIDLTSAFIRMLRVHEKFGRVHCFGIQDDLVQGANFPNHLQPHENLMSFGQLKSWTKKNRERIAFLRRRGDVSGATLLEHKMMRTILEQRRFKGEYREQEQFEKLIKGLFEANDDFFVDILATFVRSGIRFEGPSFLKDQPVDSCDLKPITFGNGNHHKGSGKRDGKTAEVQISEGYIFARNLKSLLRYHPKAVSFADRLEDLIGAPLRGVDLEAFAVIDTGRGARFGYYMRGTPTRKGPANGFPLEQAAVNAIERGNHTDCFHDVELEVQVTGDIHKGAFVWVPGYIHVSCPAATSGDPYGARGFAHSHVGGVNIGIPADGTGKAPIQITFFMEDWIDRWYEERFPIDFDRLVPTPL
jgi:hypothetical protein